MMEKIAFVCQRYGLEVNGGSELYCRQVAERLAEYYEVTVYTTCALDYTTWANHYPAGEETINGVRVKRWPVRKERKQERFDRISAKVFGPEGHTDRDEQKWIEEQGPCCPEVIRALQKEHGEYRVVFFMTYLYYLTATGMPLGFENAALIPTTHDEAPVYLRHYEKVFGAAKGLVWLTPEERAFARMRFPAVCGKPETVTGIGMDMPEGKLPEIPEELRGQKYLVYAGRIDPSKGCGEMFEYFRRYKQENGGDLKLVLMGKPVMEIPEEDDIIPLGFVSDEMKLAVMKEAFALLLHSRFESLSMVVLESMMMGRPVLVSGYCEVLKGHCERSKAGLWFESYGEYAEGLKWLQNHPGAYRQMRRNGEKYVKEDYSWDTITGKYCGMIGRFAREKKAGKTE